MVDVDVFKLVESFLALFVSEYKLLSFPLFFRLLIFFVIVISIFMVIFTSFPLFAIPIIT